MDMIQFVEVFNLLLAVVLTVAYGYQLVYLVLGLLCRRKRFGSDTPKEHRYAAVIAARNEEGVIGDLIQSLRQQNYPQELLDIYVIADNCTDATASVARKAGARVCERRDPVRKGKGYALDYFFRRLMSGCRDYYDAYMIFDADNLVDPNFTAEMNRVFDTGRYEALTCYRNSRNFGENWISAGYGLWFLREARFLNFPRMVLGTGCHVSGTGFLVSAKVIRDNGGWPFHLLTEDIQFSVDCAIKGLRIGYCEGAMIYDEQPTTAKQSWDQRMRWSKGFYQVDAKYSLPLIKSWGRLDRRAWTCYDMFMTVAPGMLLTMAIILFNLVMAAACLTQPPYVARRVMELCLEFLSSAVVGFYLGLLLYGLITTVVEWQKIGMPSWKKLLYVLTFPVFMMTYVPISLAALVCKVEWKPIYHRGGKKLPQPN